MAATGKDKRDALTTRILIDGAKAVSFDFFDTLVERSRFFFPADLFYQVADRASALIGAKASGFHGHRIAAEHAARAKAARFSRPEITLAEIYQELGARMRLTPDEAHRLKECELQCEYEALSAEPAGLALYDHARQAGKKVVIATDTYLPLEIVAKVAARNGYGDAELFVSSELCKTKLEGSLFSEIAARLGLAPADILHIGDNPLPDITMPLQAGFKAALHVNGRQKFRSGIILSKSDSGSAGVSRVMVELADICNPSRDRTTDGDAVNMISARLALVLLGFTMWIAEQAKTRRLSTLYFLARDGLIIKRAFDLLAKSTGNIVETRYLLVSRSSLYPTAIFSDPALALELYSRAWDRMTIGKAVSRLKLDFDTYRNGLFEHGFKSPSERLQPSRAAAFRAFCLEHWPAIESANRIDSELALRYLKQEGVFSEGDCAVVDIGWHMSLQRCLEAARKHEANIHGLYIGTFSNARDLVGRAESYLLSNDRPPEISRIIRSSPSLIEMFHAAPHGTVTGYKSRAGQVEPVTEVDAEETAQFNRLIKPIQNAALRHIRRWLVFLSSSPRNSIDPVLAASVGLHMVSAPGPVEAALLGQLKIATDFDGPKKSLTGIGEWHIQELDSDILPDGTMPMWPAGLAALREKA